MTGQPQFGAMPTDSPDTLLRPFVVPPTTADLAPEWPDELPDGPHATPHPGGDAWPGSGFDGEAKPRGAPASRPGPRGGDVSRPGPAAWFSAAWRGATAAPARLGLVALAAVASGAAVFVSAVGLPPGSVARRMEQPTPVTAAEKFTAVAGDGCPSTADHGFKLDGWHDDWYATTRGGWAQDGCGGRVVSVPMTGEPDRDDDSNVVVWWFRTGAARGSCSIRVYVPATGRVKDAAGRPAHYLVYGSVTPGRSPLGTFDIDQAGNQGRWVPGGTFPVTGGELSVRMVTRGVDWGDGREGSHLGASALRVECGGS